MVMLRLASITQTISTATLVTTPSPTLTVVNCVGETRAAVSGPGSTTMLTSSLASVTWDHLHQDPLTPPRLCQAGETVSSCHLTKIFNVNCGCEGRCSDVQVGKKHSYYYHNNIRIEKIDGVESTGQCRHICRVVDQCEAWTLRSSSCSILKSSDYLAYQSNSETSSLGSKTCGDCTKSLVESRDDPGLSSSAAAGVLEEKKEVSYQNYWMPPESTTGADAFFVIDLGCVKEVNGVYLRNSHNADYNNRGTRTFSIKTRIKTSDSWTQLSLANNTLDRVYSTALGETKFVAFNSFVPVRYIRFTVLSYYGAGGGLSYIQENEALRTGSSYPVCYLSSEWNSGNKDNNMKLELKYDYGEYETKSWTEVEAFTFRTETLKVSCSSGN